VAHLDTVLSGTVRWMEEHEYQSVDQMRGSMSQHDISDPALSERDNYMRVVSSRALRSPVARKS